MNIRLKINSLHRQVNLHTVLIDTSYGGYRRVIRWLTTSHTGSYDTVTVIFSKFFNDLLEYFKPLTKVEGGIVQILLPINPRVYTVTLTYYYSLFLLYYMRIHYSSNSILYYLLYYKRTLYYYLLDYCSNLCYTLYYAKYTCRWLLGSRELVKYNCPSPSTIVNGTLHKNLRY